VNINCEVDNIEAVLYFHLSYTSIRIITTSLKAKEVTHRPRDTAVKLCSCLPLFPASRL
jgi:hypothetical protein